MTGWNISWYRHSQLVNTAATNTLSVSVNDAGETVYQCHASKTIYNNYNSYDYYYTRLSDSVTITAKGESPPVSLIISPSRTQHFTRDSLSLSCEDQSNSTGWTVRRYTGRKRVLDCSQWGSVTRSTCKFSFLNQSYTGVYWCESESGENSNTVNITVHDGDVILESPVHPVTEGDPLTLHCLYRNTNPSNLRADFYKDGSVVQNQTTGEMIIHKVSKSDEGFYHCKHPERGESPRSWISVRRSRSSGKTVQVSVVLSLVCFFIVILILMLLLWYNTIKKDKQKTKQRRSGAEDSLSGQTSLQPGNEHIYATVDQAGISGPGETASESGEATYAQVTKKKTTNRNNGANAELCLNDVTYAEIQLYPIRKVKKAQEKSSVAEDTVYSELHQNMK
ncbi:low affinity immunoglobulin gamma Fc region receptor II-like [Silurus meridionalis]|uniref:low affinity immunoglobulin gamma Fc region receptor II-like n=1 Tax=Silurus meridionalis TaxID=175797 RepID=UPI001EEB765E|nr:low affinity immunoglobulin gamma Fc region receptor II-like [Silurus meridionalis]XP_046707647.1 low affinity immunoglobulin gamma Fc region receptor II-like [Silurus meridionalis]XP_046707648.1 low affinity immunoglobulin gamma Fc region receptor II-like [Silurus meridionalis]